MKKKKMVLLSFVLVLLVFGGIFLFLLNRKVEITYTYNPQAFGNPLMGYARSAWYDEVRDDIQLLYVDITWSELEPEEGQFDWESIEEENQFARWKEEGKHIVLRFVCDFPEDEEHMDIPLWLYEKTGGAGTKYHTSYGYGFSPDYNNAVFLEYHQKAVAALGERYGQDTFISYIELGSLGHWGEWHVKSSEGITPMPKQSVREQYVKQWAEAFPKAKLLMRRPFAEGEVYGVGLYNDMAGHAESTETWLSWIQEGGEYDQTGEANGLVAMPDVWYSSPIGGEFTSSIEMEQMLTTDLDQTVSLIRNSHTTFLGPKIADSEYLEGYEKVLLNMGYRVWVSQMIARPKMLGGIEVALTWENSGVAPMYADWPVVLQAVDNETGEVIAKSMVDFSLSELYPDSALTTKTTLEGVKWKEWNDISLQLYIADPMTEKPAVQLAMENVNAEEHLHDLWKGN